MFRGNNTCKNFTLKEFLERAHNTESTKDERLKADPDLKRWMTICPGSYRCLLSVVSYMTDKKKQQTLFQLFFSKKK